MCKRFIAIPLLCLVVIMAACPFSVYAVDPSSPTFPYPVNNLSGSFDITFTSNNGIYEITEDIAEVSFGELWTGLFLIPPSDLDPDDEFGNGYDVSTDTSITLEIISGGDLYIALPNNVQYSVIRNTLSQYRYEAGDYGVDFNEMPVTTYTPDGNLGGFISGTGTGDLDVRFYCYRYIPAGTYHLEFYFYEDPNINPICFGVYADTRPSMNGMVNAYINSLGNVTDDGISSIGLSDILEELWEYRESQSGDSVELSILRELEYQSSVEYLLSQVDSKWVAFLGNMVTDMSNLYFDLYYGNLDYMSYLTGLHNLGYSVSSVCATVDQCNVVSILLNSAITAGEQIERIKAKQNLEDAISDGQIEEAEKYLQDEAALIDAFDRAKFEAQLDLEYWIRLLPTNETGEYKRVFDFLLNDSYISPFILLPMSLGLVSILLGTVVHSNSGESRSSSSGRRGGKNG